MKKIDNILKIKEYDKFKCIADKCKFTCCKGWDINVDTNTYNKWKEKSELNYLLDNVRFIISNGENSYLIKKETKGVCPLLSDEGLCNIVINHGEEYLSSTCKSFPRIENNFEDVKEVTLSCSCPEVVNIISNMKEKIYIESNKALSYIEDFGALQIREALVNIIQREDITLENKLVLSYNILFNILNSDDLDYEALIEILENYKSKNYIKEELNKYKDYEKKVLSSCVSDDLEEMIISFEMIILEFLFIRHAVFFRYCINEKENINIQDIKDYIVIFSRIIENNCDAVIEFLLDIFEREILDFDYISSLTLV